MLFRNNQPVFVTLTVVVIIVQWSLTPLLWGEPLPMLPSPSAPAWDIDPTVEENTPQNQSHNGSITLPTGTAIRAWLLTELHTATTQLGQPVEAQTSQAIYVGTQVVIQKGTTLLGTVTQSLPPVEGRDAILQVKFDRLVTKNGDMVSIASHVHTQTPEYVWGGAITPGTEEVIVRHTVLGVGMYNQSTLGGKRGMGKHIQQPIGAPLTIVLDAEQPIIPPY